MLFDQTLFSMALVAAILGLCGISATIVGVAKSRLGYSWSYSPSRRRS